MWFTADQHFFHKNIIPYCGRPFKNEFAMNKELVSRFNSRVSPNDTVYIVGDLTLYGPNQFEAVKSLLDKLNGVKHLVLGNHDKFKPFDYVELGFATVHTALKVEEFWLMHDPAMSEVVKDHTVICGHVHTLFKIQRNCVNVGVDVREFYPVHIDDVRKMVLDEILADTNAPIHNCH